MITAKPVWLYPGSDPVVFEMPFWCNIQSDESAKEIWIELMQGSYPPGTILPDPDWKILEQADSVVVFDWMHAESELRQFDIDWVRKISQFRPTKWITVNPKLIDGIECVHFDYYWNNSKRAHVEKQTFHRFWGGQHCVNYQQYPINLGTRSHQFLNYHLRSELYRDRLQDFLKNNFQGYHSTSGNPYLAPNNMTKYQMSRGSCAPPGRLYFDNTYITCLIESRHLGNNSIVISEKTYDHLIQGRAVLNFSTRDFYKHLQQNNWLLPKNVDFSWDSIDNDEHRFDAYLDSINQLLSLSRLDMHHWFLDNVPCWQHNYNQLYDKPYYTLFL